MTMNCFGGACDCNGCQPVTILASTTSGPFVAAAAGYIAAGYSDTGGGALAIVDELQPPPAMLAPAWPPGGAPLDVAANAMSAFVIQSSRIDRVPWGAPASAAPLTTGASLDPSRLQIMNLGGEKLCFLKYAGLGGGGGLYCQSSMSPEVPTLLSMLDFPKALAGDGTLAYVVTSSGNAYSVDASGSTSVLAGMLSTPVGDIAVGSQIYAVNASTGVLYTMPKTGGMPSAGPTLLANTQNLRLHQGYLYAQSPTAIARVDIATFSQVEMLPTGGGSITDFDVDDRGVYFGVAGVGLRMLAISSQ
jgi:hypothetical protein